MSNPMWPCGLQDPLSSTISGVCSNSRPLSRWSSLTISSTAAPFSFCLQFFPASGSFPVSQLSALHIRWPKYWSFSFSISPSSEYSGFISFKNDCFYLFAVQGTLKVFSNTIIQNHQFFGAQLSLWSDSHVTLDMCSK